MRIAGGASFSRSNCGHRRTDASPSEPPSLPAPSLLIGGGTAPGRAGTVKLGRKVPADVLCY